MLQPPDYSRKHRPVLALFLANPGLSITLPDLLAELPRHGIQLNQARNTISHHVHNGNLIATGGTPTYCPKTKKNKVINDGALLSAPDPFPLSDPERASISQREFRNANPERARAKSARQRERQRVKRQENTGYTSEDARRERQERGRRIHASRISKAQELILALMNTRPEHDWTERELASDLKPTRGVLREALIDLGNKNRVHSTADLKANGSNTYRLPITPDPKKAPRAYTPQQLSVWERVKRSPLTMQNLIAHIRETTHASEKDARRTVDKLFHGGHLIYRPVGNTVVVKAGPAAPRCQHAA